MTLIIHEMLRKKGKATQHNRKTRQLAQGSYFSKKKSCLGWDSNPQLSAFQASPLTNVHVNMYIYTYHWKSERKETPPYPPIQDKQHIYMHVYGRAGDCIYMYQAWYMHVYMYMYIYMYIYGGLAN